jgi:hypothetical protein
MQSQRIFQGIPVSITARTSRSGSARVDYLNALVAAPFPTFAFSAVGVSVYQFGNFGTAMKLLHSFTLAQ